MFGVLHNDEMFNTSVRMHLGGKLGVNFGIDTHAACNATCIFATSSAFSLGQRKATENLGCAGRSQGLPDAY